MQEEVNNTEQSIQHVLQLYPFEVQNITLLTTKSGRVTWEVETDQGVKILKKTDVHPRRMWFIAEAHEHLQQQGLPMAPIHRTTNGGICVGAEDHAYVMYDKVEGNEIIYYHAENLNKVMQYIAQFHIASKGFNRTEGTKKRSRLEKWQKLYRWKLQELEGNKQIALTTMHDPFSQLFLANVDQMIQRGREALQALEEEPYQNWVQETINNGSFCQQDFTLARLIEVDSSPYMKEFHSITYDLPSRDLRVLLNKLMKKLSVWDNQLSIQLLQSYDSINPLTEEQYKVLWDDLKFPHMFCSISHKYYLAQKRSWSNEKYLWAIQNVIAVETSKEQFLQNLPSIYQEIKKGGL
ncbi:CotS family spore coat protein [Metabacillus iocasae]|uniref:Spore coat-associated protein S n=1 Tax=Priestia iocasae TaxID=2291674 RepID=A0ABS2QYQ7_9BACI|nr:CotS family spore coat protein [Metabacillus iocasae]MBM7704378.1 spore coat-associated protein S [Metabacillus iocasae]